MTPAQIQKQRDKIKAKINEWTVKLRELEQACPHTNVSRKAKADTGNWCPSDDTYWYEFKCPDCGKFWIEDQ
jgi:hypothetical protein